MNAPRAATEVAKTVGHLPETYRPKAPPQQVAVDPGTRAVIDDLFDRLKGIYPAWKQAWPTERELDAAKREWLAEFMRSGIRQLSQIQDGLRMARQSRGAFAPSPGQFITWCFAPSAVGAPELDRAFSEALRNTHPMQAGHARWTHAAVYHAAIASGYFSLQRLDRALGLKRFEEKYLEQCRKIGQGEVLPAVPVAALPEPAGRRTPEVANAFLAELRSKLGGPRG